MSAKNPAYIDNFSLFYNQGSRGGLNFTARTSRTGRCTTARGSTARLAADMDRRHLAKMSGGACQNCTCSVADGASAGFADAVLFIFRPILTGTDLRILAKQGLSTITRRNNPARRKTCAMPGMRCRFSLAAWFDPTLLRRCLILRSEGWSDIKVVSSSNDAVQEQTCKQSDNSWASGGPRGPLPRMGGEGSPITTFNGSAVATGTKSRIPGLGTASEPGATHGSG